MLLATLTDLKDFLNITNTDSDAILTDLLTKVSKRVETWLNRLIEKSARSKYYDAGRRLYYLPAYPIDTSASLTVYWQDQLQTVNSDYWIWDEEGMIEMYTLYEKTEPREILIGWTGGYSTVASLPEDMQLGVVMQTAFIFKSKKNIGISSISLPDGSMSMNTPLQLLPEVKDILRPYRRLPGMN